jgi:uncharacterized membrane protein
MQYDDKYSFRSGHDGHGSPFYFQRMRAIRPWAAISTGAALAVFGVSRKSWYGTAMAAAGGLLAFQGFRASHKSARPIHVECAFTINRPIEEVYSFWRNFENLSRFMRHLRSVRTTGEGRSHWEARAPLGMSIGWDAEILEERANDFILWCSLPGGSVDHRGSVEFRQAPFARGTEIIVSLDYRPPAGKAGALFARLFGENPEQQIREDLRRFKQLMEAGEIPTTEGQPSGRRSPFVRMIHAAKAEHTTMRERTAS